MTLPEWTPARLWLPILSLLLSGCASELRPAEVSQQNGECVVLLHGLGRNSDSMNPLEAALRKAGYATANIDYESRSEPIEQLAADAVPRGIRQCRAQGARRIHFVTHSLGGILVRWWLAHERPPELGRVVMLAPPNHGSEIVDRLSRYAPFRWATGPASSQLQSGPEGLPARLGPVDYPVGIIAGDRQAPWDLAFAGWLPGADDGKVSVDSARLEGMSDLLVVHASHTFIMRKAEVIDQVIAFLREGRFRLQPGSREDHTDSPATPPAGASPQAPPAADSRAGSTR